MSLPSGSALASSPILPASPTHELKALASDFWLPVDRVSHGVAMPEALQPSPLQKHSIKRQFDKGCENWLISVDLSRRHRRASSLCSNDR